MQSVGVVGIDGREGVMRGKEGRQDRSTQRVWSESDYEYDDWRRDEKKVLSSILGRGFVS